MNTYRTNNLGASELRSLSRGIYEEQEPNYVLKERQEEQTLLETNNSIKILLKDLKRKNELIMENKDESKA